MMPIKTGSTTYYASNFIWETGFKTVTTIKLHDLGPGKALQIHFNPRSSLYDESNYDGKHPCHPPVLFCIWDITTVPIKQGLLRRLIYWLRKLLRRKAL